MKKSLLALAVLGAFAASAQAQVTIGGWMAVSPKYYKVGDVNTAVRTPGQTMKAEYRIDDDTNSRIWFTGKEDLGGGMDAHFYMESRFGGDNGSAATTFGLAGGDTFVGLGSTSVGVLDFGRISASAYTQGILVELDRINSGNNLGTTTLLSDVGGFGLMKSRLNNIIRYKTPSLGGFVGTLVVSPAVGGQFGGGEEGKVASATATANNYYADGKFIALGASYSNGPIYVNAYYNKLTAEGMAGTASRTSFATADLSSARLSGSYKFPFGLKVGLSVDKSAVHDLAAGVNMGGFLNTFSAGAAGVAEGGGSSRGGSVTRTAWILPVSYIMGDHGFHGKFGKANSLSGWTPSTAGGKTGAKYFVLAYDYALSKRTAVGVSYMTLRNDNNGVYQPFTSNTTHNGSALYAGESVTVGQLNLKHSF